MSVKISIVIPCLNEVTAILNCIEAVKSRAINPGNIEIIVADAGSTDGTLEVLKTADVKVIHCAVKSRAKQMNLGATAAQGDTLYFLHADTLPPLHFDSVILEATLNHNIAGCFRLQFDYSHWFLKANAWFTKFDINSFRFGDQSLFISKNNFSNINGFNKQCLVFEDQEIINRIKQHCQFKVLPHYVVTSARMYLQNGIYSTQLYYFFLFLLHKLGVNQEIILRKYREKLGTTKRKI